MEPDEVITAQRAEVDMICDKCDCQITEGQDYFYDQYAEEVLCEECCSN